ncbi:hypothetical protein [Marinomonas algicola]|uniref:hypothetical protein n=1 Tax=Marinomonas algicola TaxID=2773454 RepID=UPI00174A3636|nr:hypothetical protein [Marinomonas algicola]
MTTDLHSVNISKEALFDMILAGLEAYSIKHDGQDIVAIETFAHMWGRVNKNLPFKCYVDHLTPETSATRTRGSVAAFEISLELKKDIAAVFGKGFEYIGTMHSHPYLKIEEEEGIVYEYDAKSIRKKKFYQCSDGDHESEFTSSTVTVGKREYSVAIILTVHAMDRARDELDGVIDEQVFEFSLGNLKMWLFAQVFEHVHNDDLTDQDAFEFGKFKLDINEFEDEFTFPIPVSTQLNCEALGTSGFLFEGFGRLKISDKDSLYTNKRQAEKRFWHNI